MKSRILIYWTLILILIIHYKINPEFWYKILQPTIEVENITVTTDIDNDWINDIDDILQWARKEVKNKTIYKSAYYQWWYPPENEWVCTDLIRRALKDAWIDLKKLVDKDIKNNTSIYQRVNWKPDPNIDFRRVPNLNTFLKRNATTLTNKLIPWNVENLKSWQPWDIVIFNQPDHIGIVSDKRDKNWVPYLIHNWWPIPSEDKRLLYWSKYWGEIVAHYRWKY